MTTKNLWDAAKGVLREKLIAVESYLKKEEEHQVDKPTLQLKQLENEEEEEHQQKLVEGNKS